MNSNIQVGVSLATSLYPNPVPSKIGVTTPVNFYETLPDGKFHVVQYDQRMHGGGAPYPAPNQMNVIPISRWKTSYLWSVPANTVQVLQGYFINLICRAADYNSDNIQVAVNGGKLSSIRSGGFSLRKVWGAGTIPDHPELMGLTYALGPSSYYVTNISQSPDAGLMIYNYGFRGIDADGDIGDFDKDDFFFAYASPVGFVSGKTENTTITATVDTLCAKWHICAHVSGKNQPGIKQITILDDPNGDLVRPAKKYSNVQFDLTVDPNNTREIDLDGNTADYCFDVDVKNPFDTAYCPLYIVDNTGNSTIIELRYTSPKLRVAYSPKEIRNGYDSVIYPVTGIGSKSCATIYYINNGDSAKGDPNIAISSATLKHQNSAFAITNTVPSLPASLGPKSSSKPNGDTLAITICFDSKDTAFHLDSLLVTSACLVAPYTLAGQGGTPLIYASDHNFGSAAIGVSKCDTVSVTNVGNLPFTLSKDFVLHDSVNFSIVPSSLAQLPKVLNPGEKISLQFCFTPTVVGLISTKVDWVTDIAVPYVNSIKSFSILNSGNVVRPGLYWDTTTTTINADSTVVPVTGVGRVFLENRQTADAYVIVVRITGPDASEFELGQNQAGYDPLERFPIRANGSIWIDLLFKPDMTKPQPARSAHRFATLTAIYNKNPSGTITDSTVMQLIGGFDTLRLGVKIQPINTVSKLTAFVQEKRLVVILPNDQQDKLSLELYDLLGRKVSDWNAAEQYKIDNRLMLPIPTVASGTYIVRLKTATGQSSCVVIAQ